MFHALFGDTGMVLKFRTCADSESCEIRFQLSRQDPFSATEHDQFAWLSGCELLLLVLPSADPARSGAWAILKMLRNHCFIKYTLFFLPKDCARQYCFSRLRRFVCSSPRKFTKEQLNQQFCSAFGKRML